MQSVSSNIGEKAAEEGGDFVNNRCGLGRFRLKYFAERVGLWIPKVSLGFGSYSPVAGAREYDPMSGDLVVS